MLSDCWNPNSHSTPNPKVDLLEKLLLTQMLKLNCQLASKTTWGTGLWVCLCGLILTKCTDVERHTTVGRTIPWSGVLDCVERTSDQWCPSLSLTVDAVNQRLQVRPL